MADRIDTRIQLTSDGHKPYLEAVEDAFGGEVDYAMLHKVYGNSATPDTRYSPPECIGCEKRPISGNPDDRFISTSHVERQNLTMRMSMRRFTRLTNGFSKKIENHEHAVAIHYMHYNFIRKHATLKTTPAVMAGIANRGWTMMDFVVMLEKEEATNGGRLTDYKPTASKKA
ncbi:MAG: IS1 family transposase [Planctomycetes bacterium]|nr:IS1 family transposase [Planctomycetota bacterium]